MGRQMASSSEATAVGTRGQELRAFLFLTVVLAPVLAVMVVGGYGFLVWMYRSSPARRARPRCDRHWKPLPPWPAAGRGAGGARVRIADACLTRRGIVCRTCGDLCPVGAIRFRPILGGVPQPAIDAGTCTLCGECGPLSRHRHRNHRCRLSCT